MLFQRTEDDLPRFRVTLDKRALPFERTHRVGIVVEIGQLYQGCDTVAAAAFDVGEVLLSITATHRIHAGDDLFREPHARQQIERHPGVFHNIVKDRDNLSDNTMFGDALHHTDRMEDVRLAGLVDLFRVCRRRDGDGTGEIGLGHVG